MHICLYVDKHTRGCQDYPSFCYAWRMQLTVFWPNSVFLSGSGMHTHTDTDTHITIHTYIHTHTHKYIHTHTHTHTHKLTLRASLRRSDPIWFLLSGSVVQLAGEHAQRFNQGRATFAATGSSLKLKVLTMSGIRAHAYYHAATRTLQQ